MKKSAFSHPAASAAFVTAALVWGGSVVGRKWALGSFSAVETSVLRGTGALAILIPLWWWQEGGAVRFTARDVAVFAALGVGVLGNHLAGVWLVNRQSEQLAAQHTPLEEAAQMTEQKAR